MPEVVEADDDQHHRREQREHRQEVRQWRDRQEADPQPRAGQERARLGQVAGDEDDEHDLQELAGLHADRPEADPQPRAVHLVADDEGRDQQEDPDRGPRVLVVAQDAVVAQADRDRQHRGQPDAEPEQLRRRHAELDAEEARPRQVLREAVEHDHADAAHGGDRRQQELVAPVARHDQDHVGGDEHRDVADREAERSRIEPSAQRDVRDHEAEGDQHQDRQQQPKLDPAPGETHQARLIGRGASARGRSSARRRS